MGFLHGLPHAGKLMDDAFEGAAELEGRDLTEEALAAKLRARLQEGLHGLGFSAYAPGQSPERHDMLSVEQVRARLEIIAPHTAWIRTFSCSEGNELAPAIAHELGMKTLVGAWIDGDRARNARELQAVVSLAKQGHADMIAVGNEVLLRGELPEEEIIEAMERVRREVPGVPVAYVDAYYLFIQSPRLVEACDFLPINCYPFWEKCSLERAVAHVQEMVRRVRTVCQGKQVLIAETGWPTEGSPEGAAIPGKTRSALYALNLFDWAKDAGVPLFWFSAFDEAWKVGAEGDCGAYWGLWDAEGKPKY